MKDFVILIVLAATFNNVLAQKMIFVKGGDYITSTNQKVKLTDFYIDENEVTISQFAEFVKKTGYKTFAEEQGYAIVTGGRKVPKVCWQYDINGNLIPEKEWVLYPVVYLTIDDILAYCKWSNKRLPTEAEWEYAFREGTNATYKYAGSNSAKKVAWSDEKDPISGLQPVRTKKPNALGIYDMSGNTCEICVSVKGDSIVWKGGTIVDDLSRFTYKSRHVFKRGKDSKASWYAGFRTVKDVK